MHPDDSLTIVANDNICRELNIKRLNISNLSLLSNLPSLYEIYKTHDFCFGSGGVSSYERIRINLPSIVITLAENQSRSNIMLSYSDLIYLTEINLIARMSRSFIINLYNKLLIAMNENKIIDGKGSQRVATTLKNYALSEEIKTLKENKDLMSGFEGFSFKLISDVPRPSSLSARNQPHGTFNVESNTYYS